MRFRAANAWDDLPPVPIVGARLGATTPGWIAREARKDTSNSREPANRCYGAFCGGCGAR